METIPRIYTLILQLVKNLCFLTITCSLMAIHEHLYLFTFYELKKKIFSGLNSAVWLDWNCSKNLHCHSATGEEFPVFLFKLKNQKRRSFGLTALGWQGKVNLQNFGTLLWLYFISKFCNGNLILFFIFQQNLYISKLMLKYNLHFFKGGLNGISHQGY
jgi:hypothetical protein